MEPLETLGLQAAVSFFSSLSGMAVYMYCYCPNHRCCQFSTVRKTLEKDRSYYEHPQHIKIIEENKNG
jgi:hypothetical protein